VLIVLLLGAIAFDLSLLFLRQRQASSVVGDIANDLATQAVDEAAFRATGDYQLDPDRADVLGRALLGQSDIAGEVVNVEIEVLGADTVQVTVVVRVDYVFAKAIPGADDGSEVRATATAVAATG
jgi:Flp pilus assembly protein TadG